MESRDGVVRLADGTGLRLKLAVFDVRDAGFSPFGGVWFVVYPAVGLVVDEVPEQVRKAVEDKPIYQGRQPPQEGWELVEVVHRESALQRLEVEARGRRYEVWVEVEPLMAARNMAYRTLLDEPLYAVNHIAKVWWR